MSIASLLGMTKCGLRAPRNCAPRGVFPSLANVPVSPLKVGRLFLNSLIQVSCLSSNLSYKRFEAFPRELKRGFLILVSASWHGLAHPSVLGDSSSGCAVRHNSAA